MGGFVAVFNYLGFRLEAPPFLIPASLASLVFIAYLSGTWSSRRSGMLVARFARLPVLLGSIGVMLAGLLVTLVDWLPSVVFGMLLFTAGFFAAHAVASGWIPLVAVGGRAQAASLYNLAYYGGSSLFGQSWAMVVRFARLPVLLGSFGIMFTGLQVTVVAWMPAIEFGHAASPPGSLPPTRWPAGGDRWWPSAGGRRPRACTTAYYGGSSLVGWAIGRRSAPEAGLR